MRNIVNRILKYAAGTLYPLKHLADDLSVIGYSPVGQTFFFDQVIEELQYMAGGVVAFLEAEPREKLLSFYQTNRFQQFDTRQTTSSEEQHELVQLLRLL